jgi:hypothetical protein
MNATVERFGLLARSREQFATLRLEHDDQTREEAALGYLMKIDDTAKLPDGAYEE